MINLYTDNGGASGGRDVDIDFVRSGDGIGGVDAEDKNNGADNKDRAARRGNGGEEGGGRVQGCGGRSGSRDEKLVDEGPPVRPVCDISDGISHRLSYLLSNMLKEVCYGNTVCGSTEEMLAAIEQCNLNNISEDFVIGSADVKAL